MSDRIAYLRYMPPPSPPMVAPSPPPSVCGASYQAPQSNMDISGSNVGNPVSTPVDNCCTACDSQPTCTGFVVVGTTCYLKDGTTFSQNGVTAYVRIPSP